MAMTHDMIAWHGRGNHGRLRTLACLQREMDGILDGFVRAGSTAPAAVMRKQAALAPRMDIAETQQSYLLTLELPGVAEEDVDVQWHEGVLTVRGEKKADATEEGRSWHRLERSFGAFQRSVTLPKEIDAEGIRATFGNGVLRIEVLKSEKKKDTHRTIEITRV